MAGRRKVEWTPEAIRQAEAILTYVRESWGDRIAGRFISLLKGFELLVLQFPHGYPASPVRPELRMATIHKNVKIIYRVDADRILVVTVLDTRAANTGW
ncbi:MAG: type II toxin-antitoxin system RelE/ParE family toxin [Flavobacteriales bacterium]|nr:type II toxin-antitoxin system RelE/ParE family toxin [Flavobacteriales bacterium]MEB2342590.1 type II toxin-antitoxin system RelE/ParE family toxin [Flavobacteriia bacterium]